MTTMMCMETQIENEVGSKLVETSLQSVAKIFRANTTLKLVMAIEMRDGDTAAHMVRVGQFASLLAWRLTGDRAFSSLLCHGAPMHDIGKLGVPDSMLKKPGPLDDAEWKVMQRHPEWGARQLHMPEDPLFRVAENVALCHHERYDGLGYPYGLSGADIPLEARIDSLADCFDALSMRRRYRAAWSRERVAHTLHDAAGTCYDPDIVGVAIVNLPEIYRLLDEVNGRWEGMDTARFDTGAFEPLFR